MTDCCNDFLVVAELSAPGDLKLDSKSRGDGALRQTVDIQVNLDLLQIKLKWDFLEVPDSLLVFNPFLLARLPVLMETLACATFFFFSP